MMVLIFSPDLVTLAVIIWFVYFIRWMVLWLAGSESFDWLLPRRTSLSLHLSCLQTPLPFCFALMRTHTHTAASYWPPALLLLHQRTLLPHTSGLWDSGWSCYSNCYAMASLLKSVSFLPPRWEESQWYSRGKGRVDFLRKGVSPLVWRNQCQQCAHTGHVSCIGVVPRSSGAAAHKTKIIFRAKLDSGTTQWREHQIFKTKQHDMLSKT